MTIKNVQEVLDEIRPQLQADGGDVEIADLSPEGILSVKLKGACQGCPHAQMTIKNGIERYLQERLPSLKSVEAV